MWIPDEQLSNVSMALKAYSEIILPQQEPKEEGITKQYWEQTRREVWALRDAIEAYWKSMPSRSEMK